ncbi:hypothetical protein CLV52_0404 [Amnibacterium kyonggiense]|uniref:Uncharacterized protein n=1 Tax=Amnibacterium kyonggiense TaxID=595671 RepID=A0A4R7FQI1_9MICO|nr:hypothetical protein CLV52_0404 [Amnibacterium kyonggiense]
MAVVHGFGLGFVDVLHPWVRVRSILSTDTVIAGPQGPVRGLPGGPAPTT